MGRRRHDEQWWFYLQLFDDYAGTKTYAVKRQQFLEDSPDVLTTRTIASYLLAASKPPKKHTVTWVLYTTTPISAARAP